MKTKIIFIPWVVALEDFADCLKWQRQALFRKRKSFHIVHSGWNNPVMLLASNGQIYVNGHGAPNDPEIGPGRGAIGGDLRFDKVADRLIRTGLRKSYHGKIKLWNCNSAVAGATSFAKQFADYMRGKGYTNCTYYGYIGTLDAFYYKGDNGSYHRFAGDDEDEGSRASNNRILIT